jgi:hypothetical protein
VNAIDNANPVALVCGLVAAACIVAIVWSYVAQLWAYGQAVREGADRDRWVSLRARQLEQICNEQEGQP